MKRVKFVTGIESFVGTLDTKKDGQKNGHRVVSRYRPGTAGHQMYSMKIHEGPWSDAVIANRELMSYVRREAHAIEKAAKHPELSTPEYINLAADWQQRFDEYKSTKKPGDKQFGTLYTYTYSHLYHEMKAGKVLDIIRDNRKAKASLYQTILPQIQSLVDGETDLVANMANIVAVLHNTFHFLWTGFYIVRDESKSENLPANNRSSEARQEILNPKSEILNPKFEITSSLVLGPFQGPVACTRIPYNKGVCGKAWAQNKTLVVPNVHEFPGHIACSSASNSEIVVPIRRNNDPNGDIIAVLDIDSADFNTFDHIDQKYLEQITL